MALDFTELDDFVAESPGAPLKSALMTELKGNIEEAASMGGFVDANSLSTADMIYGQFAGIGSYDTIQVISEYPDSSVGGLSLIICPEAPLDGSSPDMAKLAAIGNFAAYWWDWGAVGDGTYFYIFRVFNTGEAGCSFTAHPVFYLA